MTDDELVIDCAWTEAQEGFRNFTKDKIQEQADLWEKFFFVFNKYRLPGMRPEAMPWRR